MTNPDKKKEPKPERPEATTREERGEKAAAQDIDFAKLDLTVEKVEERISPSETNVFDK
jgi:hypothetical protein